MLIMLCVVLFLYLMLGFVLYSTDYFDDTYQEFCIEQATTYTFIGAAVFGIRVVKRAIVAFNTELKK